jgi:hypothetical protein
MQSGRVVNHFRVELSSSPLLHGSTRPGSAVTWHRSALLALLLFVALFWVAPWYVVPAVGSCAETQIRSPYAFTGVVVSTRSQGRVATVRTDTGATVQVLGTPETNSVATSVDRTYQVGGRYEFHPINSSSPYQDNACTFTHLLSLAPPSSEPAAATNSRALMVFGAGGFAVLGVTAALAILWRRHSRDAPAGRVDRH